MTQETKDHRRLGRLRTIFSAQAVRGNGLPDLMCQVKDLSDTGARLTVDEAAFVPDRFQLVIPKKSISQDVVVRWRHGQLLGVEFATDQESHQRNQSARIKELEAENAELRRRVTMMAERLFAYGDSERPAS